MDGRCQVGWNGGGAVVVMMVWVDGWVVRAGWDGWRVAGCRAGGTGWVTVMGDG